MIDENDKQKSVKSPSEHGNSLETSKPAKGYSLRDRDSGEVLKYGETTQEHARYSDDYLMDNNAEMVIEKSGTKRAMHKWQNEKIIEYKECNGCRPKLNLSDW